MIRFNCLITILLFGLFSQEAFARTEVIAPGLTIEIIDKILSNFREQIEKEKAGV